ncbi:MAG: FKBP-type peptidyl-prolyl cis-trans isomerase [Dissulfurispiraceae bacterium]
MNKVENGNTVKAYYNGKFNDGTIFYSSRHCEPREFTIGGGCVINGFEFVILGMSAGQKKAAVTAADDAYGSQEDDLVFTFGRSQMPWSIKPNQALILSGEEPDGGAREVIISAVMEGSVTFDANHPFAGKNLTSEVELVEIA